MLRCGDASAPQAAVLLPLFHEMDRVRPLALEMMRVLAEQGWATVLIDLPGLGESEQPLPAVLGPWQSAVDDVIEVTHATASIAIRTGALFDRAVPPARRWRFSPATGGACARDLARLAAIGSAEAGRRQTADTILSEAREAGGWFGGYCLEPDLLRALDQAEPEEDAARTLRLAGDLRPADERVEGPLLWRAAEPRPAHALAALLAQDFVATVGRCANS